VEFFIALVYVVVGCFVDAIPAIILVGTTLQPLADRMIMLVPMLLLLAMLVVWPEIALTLRNRIRPKYLT
jgi:TRAP-type C4-dicarboxylate transport system permease large subunit